LLLSYFIVIFAADLNIIWFMTHFDFTTNIEQRSPFTGNVYMVDRMTSDWAEKHPLNVNQFIEDVYQEFAGTEFEETREALRKVWTATLSMPVRGDKSVYPNNNGAHRAAAMKVWHAAGDYWRRGLRLGDVLPERCPSCKITRLEDGAWIALFPKDLHLLEEENDSNLPKIDDEDVQPKSNDSDVTMMHEEPQELSLFNTDDETTTTDAASVEDVTLTVMEAQGGNEPPSRSPEPPTLSERERNAEIRRRRREQREAQRRTYVERMEREAREAEEAARNEERRKVFALVGAVAVTAVMIYFFGLLGPAVFGLLAGGLLKG
jgi:hypothetical protein